MPRKVAITVVALSAVTAMGLVFVYWYDKTGQRPDPAFDSSVAKPFYVTSHPRLAIDAAHDNFHTAFGGYKPLADLLAHDGYEVTSNREPFTAESLRGVQVLVVVNALGEKYGDPGKPAFTPPEEDALTSWVREGGSLLLIADHAPFGFASRRLAASFGVTMHALYARDDKNKDGWDNERLVFSRANGLLADHAITNGRTPSERIERIVTFTGQSLTGPDGSVPLLRMSDDAYDWESRKVRFPARGHAQGIAFSFGSGRVVVFGEAAFLTAQVDPLGFKFGMNRPSNDDRQFALNVMHWLSKGI